MAFRFAASFSRDLYPGGWSNRERSDPAASPPSPWLQPIAFSVHSLPQDRFLDSSYFSISCRSSSFPCLPPLEMTGTGYSKKRRFLICAPSPSLAAGHSLADRQSHVRRTVPRPMAAALSFPVNPSCSFALTEKSLLFPCIPVHKIDFSTHRTLAFLAIHRHFHAYLRSK